MFSMAGIPMRHGLAALIMESVRYSEGFGPTAVILEKGSGDRTKDQQHPRGESIRRRSRL
jgi:hypothetical protein